MSVSFQRPERADICERLCLEPPNRFLTSQLTAGIKDLHVRLRARKHCIPTDSNKQEDYNQTNDKGHFQPCQPVPLLAGRYQYLEIIGEGQSAVLIAARDTYQSDHKVVAIKIMHTSHKALGSQECDLMRQLSKLDPENICRIVKLLNTFIFGQHYCLVLDYLRPKPLHKYFQNGRFQNEESKLKNIKKIAQQLVGVLGFLSRIGVIHADLKPENVLFENGKKNKIKLVDFGNAIRCTYHELSLYYDDFELQTLLYRAPEVMFGVPFGTEIDMWSLGCILAELYLGEPLFTGRNKTEMMQQMVDLLGPCPCSPFKTGKFYQEMRQFTCESILCPDNFLPEFKLMKRMNNSRNFQFANFLIQLLQYNPSKRLTPSGAAQHPFLAGLMPVKFVMPEADIYGKKFLTNYPAVLLGAEQYHRKPFISQVVLHQHLNSIELLRTGTGDPNDAIVLKTRPTTCDTLVKERNTSNPEVQITKANNLPAFYISPMSSITTSSSLSNMQSIGVDNHTISTSNVSFNRTIDSTNYSNIDITNSLCSDVGLSSGVKNIDNNKKENEQILLSDRSVNNFPRGMKRVWNKPGVQLSRKRTRHENSDLTGISEQLPTKFVIPYQPNIKKIEPHNRNHKGHLPSVGNSMISNGLGNDKIGVDYWKTKDKDNAEGETTCESNNVNSHRTTKECRTKSNLSQNSKLLQDKMKLLKNGRLHEDINNEDSVCDAEVLLL